MGQKSGPAKEPAEQLVKEIRRATRRQFSAEEKIRIVLSGLRGWAFSSCPYPAIRASPRVRGMSSQLVAPLRRRTKRLQQERLPKGLAIVDEEVVAIADAEWDRPFLPRRVQTHIGVMAVRTLCAGCAPLRNSSNAGEYGLPDPLYPCSSREATR